MDLITGYMQPIYGIGCMLVLYVIIRIVLIIFKDRRKNDGRGKT